MYASVVRFVLGPDKQWESEHIADYIGHRLKRQPGCEGVHFLMDHHTGEHMWMAYWNAMEDADSAHQSVYPLFLEMVGSAFQWEPVLQVYEVYAPRTITRSE